MQFSHKLETITLAVAILLFSSVPSYPGELAPNTTQSTLGVTPSPTVVSPPVPGTTPDPPTLPYYKPAAPAYAPPPVVAPTTPQQLVLPDTPPQFVYIRDLNYYVAVAVPYELVYIRPNFYLYNNGYWYVASNWDDPWVAVAPQLLPRVLGGFDVVRFRRHRDRYRGGRF